MGLLKAEYKYEQARLICDVATVERVHSLLRIELNVDLPVPDGMVVRSVVVSIEPPPFPKLTWRLWPYYVAWALGMAWSGLFFVAGLIKVTEWVSMFL